MRSVLRRWMALASLLIVSVFLVPTAAAMGNGPGGSILGTDGEGTVVIAEVGAQNVFFKEINDAVPPVTGADRATETVSTADPPCAVWSDGSGSSSLASISSDQAEADYEAERRRNEGASAEEILDFINNGGPMNDSRGKIAKSPVSRSRGVGQVHEVDAAATTKLLLELNDAAETPSTSPTGDVVRECLVEYVCSAERVDDVVSGHIDSEPDGAFAEYVVGIAIVLDETTETIRNVEEFPPADTAVIPVPSSDEGVSSLAGALAERGLDERPGELYLPVFNYCRIGPGGEIETTVEAYDPSFTWTALVDEFDIPGGLVAVFDDVNRQIRAELPDMRTIPPIDIGHTFVQFPMWLWLDEPFPGTDVSASGALDTVRVSGRARFHHVTWTLGGEEIVCGLDDMREYVVGTGMDPADKPDCSHTFKELLDYQMTAEVTYRLEQKIELRDSPSLPWPAAAWQPHTPEFATVSSTTPQLSVVGLYSVNAPLDLTAEEINAIAEGD